jgi:hypothetical protein
MDFKDDPRAKRTELEGYSLDNSLRINIGSQYTRYPVALQFIEGLHSRLHGYFAFEYTKERLKAIAHLAYVPGRMTVDIFTLNYGNVGVFMRRPIFPVEY